MLSQKCKISLIMSLIHFQSTSYIKLKKVKKKKNRVKRHATPKETKKTQQYIYRYLVK